MPLLFAGGEIGAFTPSDSTVYEITTAGSFTSPIARAAVFCENSASYAETPTVTTTADFWLRADVKQSGAFNPDTTYLRLIEMLDSGGTARVRLTAQSTPGTTCNWQMQYWNGSAWIAAGTFTASANTLQSIDMHVVANTASGSIKCYMSGTLRSDSGTVDLSAFTGISKARCWGKTIGIAYGVAYSQIVISDEATIGGRLFTAPIAGAGATSNWSGTYAEIDEIRYSDTDYVNSGTANQVSTFSISAPALTGYVAKAVSVYARAKRDASGPANLQVALRVSGTDYYSGTLALDFGYAAVGYVWNTNPASAGSWTNTPIATMQPGVKSIT
jgi:hypothetical protein